MRLAPEMRFLERIRWQVFCTLTFRGRVPRHDRRERLLRDWLSSVASLSRVPHQGRLLWVVRDEAGEKFGRPHFHVLIGGIPSLSLSPALLYRAKFQWKAVGFSDFRMWLEGLGALEYIGEDSANCYEASKFCYATGLILSESLLDMASTGDIGDSGGVEHARNPRSVCAMPDKTGLDQQSRLASRGASFLRVVGAPAMQESDA